MWLSRYWTPERAPRLRARVGKLYRLAHGVVSGMRHFFWRKIRLLDHGGRWVKVYGGRSLYVIADDYRAYRIAQSGGTQKEKIALWRELAKRSPEVAVDVGANYGEFSAIAAEAGLPVIAVEANARLAACLRKTFSSDKRVMIVNAAATDADGSVKFYYNPRSSGSGSLSGSLPSDEKTNFGRLGVVQETQVPAKCLDTLVPEIFGHMPRSFMLKIDVEGFEEKVLRGAQALLSSADWWAALVEYSPSAAIGAGLDSRRLWNMLRAHPGTIVVPTGVAPQMLCADLPVDPPHYECDVLIGRGLPGSR